MGIKHSGSVAWEASSIKTELKRNPSKTEAPAESQVETTTSALRITLR